MTSRGQGLVEFVIVIVLFCFMLLYVIQIAELNMARSLLNVAAYSAARKLSVSHEIDLAEEAANLYLEKIAVEGSVEVSAEPEEPGFGHPFVVSVSMQHRLLPFPVIQDLFDWSTYEDVLSRTTWTGKSRPTRKDLHLQANQTFQISDETPAGYEYYDWDVTILERTQIHTLFGWKSHWYFHPCHVRLPGPAERSPTTRDCGYHNHGGKVIGKRYTYWVCQLPEMGHGCSAHPPSTNPGGAPYFRYDVVIITREVIEGEPGIVTLETMAAMAAD